MRKLKHHAHLAPVILILALIFLWSAASAVKILAQTGTGMPNCTIQCEDWSKCSSDGTQTRTCHPYPTTCPGSATTDSRTCNYTPPTCTSFTYSSWSDCQPDGTQTRSVTSKSPSGCAGGNPETEKTCTYISCTTQCTDWSACSTAGTQTRTCHPYPTTCNGSATTESRTCIYNAPSCTYTYTDWGSCNSDGLQYREIKSYSPSGCTGGTVEELKRHCTYTNTDTSTGNADTSTQITSNMATVPASQEGSTNTTDIVSQSTAPVDASWSVNNDWKTEHFGGSNCPESNCGGDADPDKDRLTNNDEVRYGTDPLNPDTDGDGKLDGDEVASGTDPLKPAKPEEEDKMVYENPKEKGELKKDIYSVTKVETVDLGDGKQGLKVSGKGPANSYITVYIYSGQPIIVTVKTDSNGDWTYTVDKELENGDHEVYAAVTNNTGEIKAKSEPLPFVKTAEAITVTPTAESVQPTTKTSSGITLQKILYIFSFSLFAAAAAIILIGRAIKKAGEQKENDTVP